MVIWQPIITDFMVPELFFWAGFQATSAAESMISLPFSSTEGYEYTHWMAPLSEILSIWYSGS
jgi:hypothetical protein